MVGDGDNFSKSELSADGEVKKDNISVSDASQTAALEEEQVAPPWHFKLLVIGTVGYLIYRLIWFIFLLTGHAWNG